MKTREQQLFDKVKQNKDHINHVFEDARNILANKHPSRETMLGLMYLSRINSYIFQEGIFNPEHPEPDYSYSDDELTILFTNRNNKEFYFEVSFVEDENGIRNVKTNMFVGPDFHPEDLYFECAYPDYDNWLEEGEPVPIATITLNTSQMNDLDIVISPNDKELYDYIKKAHQVFFPNHEMNEKTIKEVLMVSASVYQKLAIDHPLNHEAFVDSMEAVLENNDGDVSILPSYKDDIKLEMGRFIENYLPLFEGEDKKLLINNDGYCDGIIGYIVLYARLIKEIQDRIDSQK